MLPFLHVPGGCRFPSLRRVVLAESMEDLPGRAERGGVGERRHELDSAQFPLSCHVDKDGGDVDVVVDQGTVVGQKRQSFLAESKEKTPSLVRHISIIHQAVNVVFYKNLRTGQKTPLETLYIAV